MTVKEVDLGEIILSVDISRRDETYSFQEIFIDVNKTLANLLIVS